MTVKEINVSCDIRNELYKNKTADIDTHVTYFINR